MKKRKVLVLKKDSNNCWSALYQGHVIFVAGGWMKVKRHFWSEAEWLPTVSEFISVIDIRKSNAGIWRELGIEDEKKIGFKTKPVKKKK